MADPLTFAIYHGYDEHGRKIETDEVVEHRARPKPTRPQPKNPTTDRMREYIAAELPDVIDKLVLEVKRGSVDDMLKSAKILLDKDIGVNGYRGQVSYFSYNSWHQ